MFTTEARKTKRRALVTGATGYIGSSLARRLAADSWDVHVIVREDSCLDRLESIRPSVTIHCHDGTTQRMIEIVDRARPDRVFHLASLFLLLHQPKDVEALILSNLLFSTQLMEAMAENQVKYLVNTSTSWQHYKDAAYNPVNLYAATKQAFEDILAYYIDVRGIKVSTLVLSDTYGPNDPRPKLMALLWKTAFAQVRLDMSPGEQMIDLVHIDDVIDAYILSSKQLPQQTEGHARFGVSSGKPLRLIDLVKVFEQATGLTLQITWGGRPYRSREVMSPWANYKILPGWKPRVELAKGIQQSRPAA